MSHWDYDEKYYPDNTSTPLGASYYKGRINSQRHEKQDHEPESMIVDGFDLRDPIDFAFWSAAQQLKQENEKKDKEKKKQHSSV